MCPCSYRKTSLHVPYNGFALYWKFFVVFWQAHIVEEAVGVVVVGHRLIAVLVFVVMPSSIQGTIMADTIEASCLTPFVFPSF